MRALVTGAEGFVGKYLIDSLLSHNYTVAGTFLKEQPSLKIKTYRLDILDHKAIVTILKDFKPDFIFHLAAVSNVKYSFENPKLTFQVNVEGTRNLLQAGVKSRILIVGTAHEYGIPKTVPITEDHALNPCSPYAESKVSAEKIALGFRNAVIVRSFNHIGPGQSPEFVVPSFARQIAEIENGKGPILHVGNLDSERDFTDVRDIVRAYILALKKADTTTVYNICSGKSYRIAEILNILLSLSSAKIRVVREPTKLLQTDIPVLLGDYSKFRLKTGWYPVIDIKKSLSDILEYERSRG